MCTDMYSEGRASIAQVVSLLLLRTLLIYSASAKFNQKVGCCRQVYRKPKRLFGGPDKDLQPSSATGR